MGNYQKRILFSEEQIHERVTELGNVISNEYKDKKLFIISLLKGSFIFTADLVRAINIPVIIDFMTTSSYGHGEVSTGRVQIVYDVRGDLTDYDVLIVDDILDTGYTMQAVITHLQTKNPNSIKSCTFLDKPSRRKVDVQPDYTGHVIEDLFVVGYGLNYGNYHRNIPYIYVNEPSR